MNRKSSISILAQVILLIATSSTTIKAQPQVNWFNSYRAGDDAFSNALMDVYRTSDGGYALCGVRSNPSGFWLVLCSASGEELINTWFRHPQAGNGFSIAVTLIETDGGQYAIGGHSVVDDATELCGAMVDREGNLRWIEALGEGFRSSYCSAVIELKQGDLLFAGRVVRDNSNQDAYLVRTTTDGEIVWRNCYGEEDTHELFHAIREVADEGIITAGRKWNRNTNDHDFWLCKISFDGEVIWSQIYEGERNEWLTGMTSCQGGFAMAGVYTFQDENRWVLKRVDNQGHLEWSETYEYIGINPAGTTLYCSGVVRMPDDGFALYGSTYAPEPIRGICARTSSGGELLWARADLILDGRLAYSGAIVDADGAISLAGAWDDSEIIGRQHQSGVLVKLWAEHNAPRIIRCLPLEFYLEILNGCSVTFSAYAEDHDDNILTYSWLLNGGDIGADTSVTIEFERIGTDTVTVIVSDNALTDRRSWHVQVSSLFIFSHSPDSLALSLRRGTSQDFSLDSVAAIAAQEEIQYQWTLTDLDNFEREDAGRDARATVEFLRSGNFQLEGLAFAGEGDNLAQDNVIWTIQVRSAILDFLPHSLNLSVSRGATVTFELIPFNPDSDSLRHQWLLDGEPWDVDSLAVRIPFAQEGAHTVTGILMDRVDEEDGDTITWRINVLPPAAADNLQSATFNFQLLPPSPNPFNSSTVIRFNAGGSEVTELAVYDLSGRLVADLLTGRNAYPPQSKIQNHTSEVRSVVWNASFLPSGIYIIRLESAGTVVTRKALLVR